MPEREPNLEPSWLEVLKNEFEQPYMHELRAFLVAEKQRYQIYPKGSEIFNAFAATPFHRVRVVILGQDPSHEPNQAHGLAFSVRRGTAKPPPSLVNIFKELNAEYGLPFPPHGELTHWAEQGVLLLNTVLTVAAGRANSHKNLGWQRFTDAVIAALSRLPQPLAFVLWGAPARQAYDAAVGAHSVRPPDAAEGMQNAKCKMQNE